MDSTSISALSPDALDRHLPGLAEVLSACVTAGASVSFVLPHTLDDSLAFWSGSVRPALVQGDRVLLVARLDGRLAGTVQLDCDTPPNQPHRADVSKLLVHPGFRRRGLARELMIAIEEEAKARGRRLITLDTASNAAEALYLSLGYERAGVIPGYARDPIEDRYDPTTIMFKRL